MSKKERLTGHAEEETTLVSQIYHENSKLYPCNLPLFSKINFFNNSLEGRDLVERAGKVYPCAFRTDLPEPKDIDMSIAEAIFDRKSSSRFNGHQLTLEEAATLLKYGNGTTHFAKEKGLYRRAIPSGGALYPTEVYLLPLDMPELEVGAYHYEPRKHRLAKFEERASEPTLAKACTTDLALPTASAAIVITACFERQQVKYEERAYRFSLLECGHLCQNILLMAAALGLGALPVGGFMDDFVNDYLQLDGTTESAIYVILVGGIKE